jgi:hypothetical protein
MPLDPTRVLALLFETAGCHDPADRTAMLGRKCSSDPELRRRVVAVLRVHDELQGFRNPSFAVTANPARRNPLLSDYHWRLRRRG